MEHVKTVNQSEEVTPLFQAAIRAGIILGLISTAITFLVYFVDYTLLASGWLGFGSFAIMLAVVIYFGIEYRREIGGFMSFGKAFKFSFFSLVVSALIATIASLLLFNVVDPNLATVLGDVQLENTLAIMDRFGAGDSLSADQIDEMRQGFYDNYKVAGALKSFGFLILGSAFFALILGAIIKKRDKSLDY